MKLRDAREIVEAARVDPTYYNLDGDRHEALCIVASGTERKVYVSERGSRYEERTFDTEDDALYAYVLPAHDRAAADAFAAALDS